jgi:RNA polymerase sigma-70 factor (ECF subfamily)
LEDEARQIRLAQGGDKAALQRLVAGYYPYVTKYLLRLTSDAELTQDLTQDTFLKLVRYIDRFDPQGTANFGTWVMTIAKHCYFDHLRRCRNQAVPLDELGYEPAAGGNMERETEERLAFGEALRALGNLPPEQAAAIRMRHLEQCSLEEIAAATGTQAKTVKSRLHHGLLKIRKSMS